MWHPDWIVLIALLLTATMLSAPANSSSPPLNFPAVDQLPANPNLPDPLLMLDGSRVTAAEQWRNRRKPELKALFQHYMYGFMPDPPRIQTTVRSFNEHCLGGKATLKQVSIALGPAGCPPIELMLVVPNHRLNQLPPPVFLGLNFGGNHTVLNDTSIALPTGWVPAGDSVVDNRATEAGRGKAAGAWAVEHVIDRGYAVATFYSGDVAPDRPDATSGVFPHFPLHHTAGRGADDWGVIAAWAWGLQRAVDYLLTDKEVDARRIVVFGHSRHGKAALLAGAFDERIAAVIPHQAGCGGSAPSRCHNPKAETVTRINTTFPVWFDSVFHGFNGHEEKLPFDQNCLVALCAPRPVLLTTGSLDQWANPPGQFDVLRAARPVYRLLGAQGMAASVTQPETDKRVGQELQFYIRDAAHGVDQAYWDTFIDFANETLVWRNA